MYQGNKKIMVALGSTFLICIILASVFVFLNVSKAIGSILSCTSSIRNSSISTEQPVILPTTASCINLSAWKGYYILLIPPMVYESILFSFAMFRGYQAITGSLPGGRGNGVLASLVQDSMVYFVMYVHLCLSSLKNGCLSPCL